jgi:putative transposase
MSDKYKMRENEKAYFVTLTVVDWLDVFTRKNHKLKLVESHIYS